MKIHLVLPDVLLVHLHAMLDPVLEARFDLAAVLHLGRDSSKKIAELVLSERGQGRRVHDESSKADPLGGG